MDIQTIINKMNGKRLYIFVEKDGQKLDINAVKESKSSCEAQVVYNDLQDKLSLESASKYFQHFVTTILCGTQKDKISALSAQSCGLILEDSRNKTTQLSFADLAQAFNSITLENDVSEGFILRLYTSKDDYSFSIKTVVMVKYKQLDLFKEVEKTKEAVAA